jgi:hypothetical protein
MTAHVLVRRGLVVRGWLALLHAVRQPDRAHGVDIHLRLAVATGRNDKRRGAHLVIRLVHVFVPHNNVNLAFATVAQHDKRQIQRESSCE